MSMRGILLNIDGKELSFDRLWVHMQDPYRATPVIYRIEVPIELAHQVFDPYYYKDRDKGWVPYIKEHVSELGTFIVEGYLENMKTITGCLNPASEWVLATVDEVRQSEDV